tara:strand:+ start:11301 stop:12470 length:1170 start_codon:yes stop_codon:yes gene_type:complete
MKILTVSASPYLLVRNGRINAAMIESLVDERHQVSTAAWHHDEGFFLPEEGGAHWYEKDERKLAEVYPIEPHAQGSAPLYELMKKVQPDVVISIGDYKETDFIWEIKAMIPNLFKWIAVLTIDCLPINENHKQQLEYADYVVSTSDFGDEALRSFINAEIKQIDFGPSDVFFEESDTERSLSFMTSCKNAQSTNLGAFIKAMSDIDAEGYLHTNLYDPGDYDMDLLLDRYGASNVSLPSQYVSVKESISDEEMRDVYSSHTFYVEPSVKSASCLSMLEAMACGCIPIGMKFGRSKEIIEQLGDERLFVSHETYIGANEEEFSVISIEGLSRQMFELYEWAQQEPKALKNLSDKARQIASSYRQQDFLKSFNRIVGKTVSSATSIAVDTF